MYSSDIWIKNKQRETSYDTSELFQLAEAALKYVVPRNFDGVLDEIQIDTHEDDNAEIVMSLSFLTFIIYTIITIV